MRVQTNVRPEQVRQTARHVLFVEGSNDDAFDPSVLAQLLPMITFKAIGPSTNIRAAAEAMHAHHPEYYFVVVRDHHTDAMVEESWNRFPDPSCSNIILWRKRELENYFLDLAYLAKSEYVHCTADQLESTICALGRERLWLEVTNRVIIELREQVKAKWIDLFSDPARITSRDQAVQCLLTAPQIATLPARIGELLQPHALEDLFDRTLLDWTDGAAGLDCNRGSWLCSMSGKKIFTALVNRCFKVKSLDGNRIVGRAASKIVARQLLSLPLEAQPADFRILRRLIEGVVVA